MFRSPIYANLLISISFLIAHEVAFSADSSALEITAIHGKTICQSKEQKRGNSLINAELCVINGFFSHDTYQLKINNDTILKGIDDETTKGISSNYNGEKIQLTCVPKHRAPSDVSPEKIAAVQKIRPQFSQEEATKIAILMETVEVSRSCVVLLGNDSLIELLVKFE